MRREKNRAGEERKKEKKLAKKRYRSAKDVSDHRITLSCTYIHTCKEKMA